MNKLWIFKIFTGTHRKFWGRMKNLVETETGMKMMQWRGIPVTFRIIKYGQEKDQQNVNFYDILVTKLSFKWNKTASLIGWDEMMIDLF